MGKDRRSRSPKLDRHHRSSHRERSRDRESSSSKHKKHRRSSPVSNHKHRSKDEPHRSTDSVSVKRYDTTQRGIDAARNRLRASLGSAINDLRADRADQPASSRAGDYNFSDSMSVFDTLNRQKAIEEIEQPGFAPFRFTSGENRDASSKKTDDVSAEVKMHERAIFGAMWTSREIEQKLAKQKAGSGALADKTMDVDVEDVDLKLVDLPETRFPTDLLAHERLSADPAAREAKWLEIFRHRRRALIEGQ